MKDKSQMSRRDLIMTGAGAAAMMPLALSSAVQAKDKKADDKKAAGKEIEEKLLLPKTHPMSTALKYYHDAGEATKAGVRKAEKFGVAADKQFCDNCALYKEPFGTLKGTKEAVGKCQMIVGGDNTWVKAKGWCNSWQKKA